MRKIIYLILATLTLCLSGCYNKKYAEGRHYSFNYNFVVKADSIDLLRQQPEELASDLMTDSFIVKKGSHLVVADFRVMPNDTIDSVWVQVATQNSEFGWTREAELLPAVVPDDPISQFISTFSDQHVLYSLIVVILIAFLYLLFKVNRHNAHIVHFNDIDSFYPMLLAIIVAVAATFYASLQMFAPELWEQFYYHPTLNPFSVPGLLSAFLVSFWAMIIVGVAVLDDIRGKLPFGETLLYLGGLVGVCAINYIVFSITTHWYVGYVLLAIYIVFAIRMYRRRSGKST
ncbi:MAG: zinc ribbon domain-containing protein [Prevotella sp.]|nr:zinc ribbon domain-containing protein [Prevotella sp.]